MAETSEIGWIKEISQEVSGEGRNGTWYRQNFVIETREQYSRDIDFQVWGRKIDLSTLSVGEKVRVYFNLQSQQSNGRWFTNATAWKIDRNIDGAQTQPQQQSAPQPQPQNTQAQVNAQIASASQNLNPPSAPPSAPQPEQVPQGDDLPF